MPLKTDGAKLVAGAAALPGSTIAQPTVNDAALTPAAPTTPQNNLYEVAYATTTKRAVDNFQMMNGAISATADPFCSETCVTHGLLWS